LFAKKQIVVNLRGMEATDNKSSHFKYEYISLDTRN